MCHRAHTRHILLPFVLTQPVITLIMYILLQRHVYMSNVLFRLTLPSMGYFYWIHNKQPGFGCHGKKLLECASQNSFDKEYWRWNSSTPHLNKSIMMMHHKECTIHYNTSPILQHCPHTSLLGGKWKKECIKKKRCPWSSIISIINIELGKESIFKFAYT